jgi:ferredoxin-thioredoxin reductase catalytic subunit
MIDLDYISNNIREGFIINPNEKVVNGIIKGINRNNGECPCSNDSIDKLCPCSNYRELGKCCCTLYIKTNN